MMDSEMLTGGISGVATGEVKDDNTFKILIASDIHLGYNDNNTSREDDSFITFEEILQIGRDENVDFVLLGGDLFHENKPRPACLQRTMEILRKYCFGSKPVEFEYLGDPAVDFPNQEHAEVNYLNPDVNIAMPVFTIHGNHDDPVGTKKTSAVDHLVAAKLVNHFGQWDDLNKVNIQAVPFIKGDTKLALFGLGNIKDERLFRLMRDQKVSFIRPIESQEEWFNIFVIHQNRVKHGPKNYIPESYLPDFVDLVIWGHEHECRIDPEPSEADVKTYIIQPGSSVATSLCSGEAREKFVGILSVNKRQFRLEKKKLRTVRPLMFDDIIIHDVLPNLAKEKDVSKAVEIYVKKRVEMLLTSSLDLLSGHEKQPIHPLIRVRIHHENTDESFNPIRFAHTFTGRIVNDDIVMFKRASGQRNTDGEMDVEGMHDMIHGHDDADLDNHVESIVEAFFTKARENNDQANILEVLSERGLSEAVKSSVEKDDKEAISVIIESQMQKVIKYLINQKVDTEDTIEDGLVEFRARRLVQPDREGAEALEVLQGRPTKTTRNSNGTASDEEEEANESHEEDDNDGSAIDDDEPVPSKKSSKGRGRGRGQAAAQPRGRGRGRGRGKSNVMESDDEEPSPAKSQRGRGRAGTTSSSRGKLPAAKGLKPLVQTTLPVTRRTSPRKSKGAMVFDTDSE